MKKNFELSSELYSKGNVMKAIEDFKDIATIEFDNYKLIISWEDDDDIEETFAELLNYIISLEC